LGASPTAKPRSSMPAFLFEQDIQKLAMAKNETR
jgi:hypothetical protein